MVYGETWGFGLIFSTWLVLTSFIDSSLFPHRSLPHTNFLSLFSLSGPVSETFRDIAPSVHGLICLGKFYKTLFFPSHPAPHSDRTLLIYISKYGRAGWGYRHVHQRCILCYCMHGPPSGRVGSGRGSLAGQPSPATRPNLLQAALVTSRSEILGFAQNQCVRARFNEAELVWLCLADHPTSSDGERSLRDPWGAVSPRCEPAGQAQGLETQAGFPALL